MRYNFLYGKVTNIIFSLIEELLEGVAQKEIFRVFQNKDNQIIENNGSDIGPPDFQLITHHKDGTSFEMLVKNLSTSDE